MMENNDIMAKYRHKGLFISMPSRRRKDGFRDIVHPLNADTRTKIENKIIEEYNNNSTAITEAPVSFEEDQAVL